MSHIFFFFNDPATTEIYTLSLHDALPICTACARRRGRRGPAGPLRVPPRTCRDRKSTRLNSSHRCISYAVFCLKKKKTDALDEEKWLKMLCRFVKDWFRYESHFEHVSDCL